MCIVSRIMLISIGLMVGVLGANISAFLAPYQVSIRLKNLYQEQFGNITNIHICNGVIIHEKYVLTTSSCCFLPIMNYSRLLLAGEITVIAGNISKSSLEGVQRNVVSIISHARYNRQKFENDIAVLKLDRALPLSRSNHEVEWLDIHNSSTSTENCFSTVFNYSIAETALNPYSSAKNVSVLQHWICDSSISGNNSIRKNDLCLEYSMSADFCNASTRSLRYSGERGTAYICNNKLVGILAEINNPKNAEKCLQTMKTTAFYVNVPSYLGWILEETGIDRLGVKNKTDSVIVPGWTESTGLPPKKNDGNVIAFCGFLVVLLVSLNYLFKRNSFI